MNTSTPMVLHRVLSTTKKFDYRQLGESNQSKFLDQGFIVHENFLSNDDILELQDLAKELSSYSHTNKYFFSIYGYPITEPSNDLSQTPTETYSSVLGGEHLTNLKPGELFSAKNFLEYLKGLFDYKHIYGFLYPKAAITMTYMRQGNIVDWHFDKHNIVCILPIYQSSNGGEFDIVPNLRGNESSIREYLGGQNSYTNVNLEIGDLIILNGKRSLHRVRKILSNDLRVSLILSFDKYNDFQISPDDLKVRYG